MTKNRFYSICPKTRAEFVQKFREDKVFRFWAEAYGFKVVWDSVFLYGEVLAGPRVI